MSDDSYHHSSSFKFAIIVACAVSYFFLSAILFVHLDKISYAEALFLNMITYTTIGYGISTDWPIVWSFHILISVVLVGVILFKVITLCLEKCYGCGEHMLGIESESGDGRCCTCVKEHMYMIILWVVATILIIAFMICFVYDLHVSWAQSWFIVVQTMTTVGFGDVVPNTGVSLWMSIFLAPCLIIVFVACTGSLLSLCEEDTIEEKLKELRKTRVWNDIATDWDMNDDNNLTQAEFVAMFLARMNDVSDEDLEFIKQGYFDLQEI